MKLEQIAIATNTKADLMLALTMAFGLKQPWVVDEVKSKAVVFGEEGENLAVLNFNYELGFELEVLEYREGRNWHQDRIAQGFQFPFISHIGYHCNEEEAQDKIAEMALLEIGIAQEVWTEEHTNPVIAGKRKYHYIVFDSVAKLGFDLKLIVRIDV
jgi:hypothetical protein